jgi:hypothetical protein
MISDTIGYQQERGLRFANRSSLAATAELALHLEDKKKPHLPLCHHPSSLCGPSFFLSRSTGAGTMVIAVSVIMPLRSENSNTPEGNCPARLREIS